MEGIDRQQALQPGYREEKGEASQPRDRHSPTSNWQQPFYDTRTQFKRRYLHHNRQANENS